MTYFHIFIYTLFISFSLGQLGRISFLNQEVNVYLYEIVMGIGLLDFIWIYKMNPFIESFKKFKWIIIFLVYLTFSFLISTFYFTSSENIIASLYLQRLWFYFLTFFYLHYHFEKKVKDKKYLGQGMIALTVITIITSFIQYFIFPSFYPFRFLGWDPHVGRMVGVWFDPPIAGSIYGLLLIFWLYKFKFKINSIISYILPVTLFFMILLTYSRGVYVALIITSLLYIFKQKYYQYLFFLIGMVILGFLLLPKPAGESTNILRVFTIESRIENYREGIQTWLESPITGVGYNHIRYVKEDKGLVEQYRYVSHSGASYHSTFLILLASSGIIGLLIYLKMLTEMMNKNLLIKYSLVFLIVTSLTDNILLSNFLISLLLLFLSLNMIKYPDVRNN